jgi:hypothetical protein
VKGKSACGRRQPVGGEVLADGASDGAGSRRCTAASSLTQEQQHGAMMKVGCSKSAANGGD